MLLNIIYRLLYPLQLFCSRSKINQLHLILSNRAYRRCDRLVREVILQALYIVDEIRSTES